jgi:prolyl-tRNA editing enzyme YbaK/EbsC (Cys-tRNA(Pro) deacylase)
MISKKLAKYLTENKSIHEVVEHKPVFTAFDAAMTMKVRPSQIAKSLLIKLNKPLVHGQKPYAIVVVPADKNINLNKLPKTISNRDVRITKVSIPKEGAIKDKFKIKPGAVPSFGGLFKLPVFVDKNLKGVCIFSSGSLAESIKMKATDFIKLENATTGDFSLAKKVKKSKVKAKSQVAKKKTKKPVKKTNSKTKTKAKKPIAKKKVAPKKVVAKKTKTKISQKTAPKKTVSKNKKVKVISH